jgi:hypothetical protein
MRRLHGPGRADGVTGAELGEEAGLEHFAEEVEAVVAGRAVAAEADGEAAVEEPGDGCRAAGELHVRGRAVGDGAAVQGEAIDVFLVEVDGMHADQVGAKQPQASRRAIGRWPKSRRLSLISLAVSWMWMWMGSSSSSARAPMRSKLACRRRCRARGGRG